MRRRKTRTKKRELTAAGVAALCLAGCGGGGGERAAPPPPKLPAPLATSLAARSDAVAAALSQNDPCRAAAEARSLQQQTIDAINADRVPSAFEEELSAAVNDLAGRIECVPPPEDDQAQNDEQGESDKGKGKKKGKAKGKHKHGKDD